MRHEPTGSPNPQGAAMDTRRTTSRATRLLAVLATGVCALRAAPPVVAAPGTTAPVTAVIDAGRTSAPINPNLYGMFIEHAGSLVYRGMWAEMLDDRKFFNPITPETAAPPPARRGPFGGPPRRWTPVGPAESVTWTPGTPTSATTPPRSRSPPASLAASARRGWPPARQVLRRPHRPRRRSCRAGLRQPRLGKRSHGPPDADDREADVRLRPRSRSPSSARSTATTARSRSPRPAPAPCASAPCR